jgi:hypothetical protein
MRAHSLAQDRRNLMAEIEEFMHACHEKPKPFGWKATVEDIIKKIDRARAKLEQINHQV